MVSGSATSFASPCSVNKTIFLHIQSELRAACITALFFSPRRKKQQESSFTTGFLYSFIDLPHKLQLYRI
jgi:hypothetical protein